ncbi:MAG: LamG domain-containing protein [Planctomycetota bacterium]|jgi:hypothetical protein
MKKLILICLVASLLPAAFGAQIIKDSEFDLPYAEGDATSGGTLLWWGNWNYTHTWGFYFTGTTFVTSGWGNPSGDWGSGACWQGTGEPFQPDTVYTMNVRWYDGQENGGATPDISTVHAVLYRVGEDSFGDPITEDIVVVADTPVAVDVWQDLNFTFDTAANPDVLGDEIWAGFRLTDDSGAWVYVDSITLSYPSANLVVPADGDSSAGTITGSTVDVDLEWTAAVSPRGSVTKHLLYGPVKDDPNVPGAPTDKGLTATHTSTGLEANATYYWRIDEGIVASPTPTDPNDVIRGQTWSFTTAAVDPVIESDPNDTLVPVGGTAVFEVVATSVPIYPITGYQWYISDDAANDTPTDALIGTGNPLNYNPSVSDAGKFVYCVVSNSSGGSTASGVALLEVERTMGRWTLDSTLQSTPSGQLGSSTLMAYAAGINGNAADLPGNTDYVIGISGSEATYNNFHLGLTASAWVNTSYNGNWQIIAGKQDRATTSSVGWSLNLNPAGNVQLGGVGADILSTASANDGAWHLVTATFDGSVVKLYVDGVLDTTSDPLDTPVDNTALNDWAVEIGGELATSTFSAQGLVDDVRIYNYAVSATQVVDLYNEFAGPINVCAADYASHLDSNGDCKIDIVDFADFASNWLEDGCYPGSYPCN